MRRRLLMRMGLVVIALFVSCRPIRAAGSIVLKNDAWAVAIQPGTLAVTARYGAGSFPLSAGQAGLGSVRGVTRHGNVVRWELPEKGVAVSMRLDGSGLAVSIRSLRAGTFTWPVVPLAKPARALTWPRWEGCYVPLDDARWSRYLIDYGVWNTTEGLTLPFWGVDMGGATLTYIVTNTYNNGIRFAAEGGRLTARFSHEFTPNRAVREYGFLIRLSRTASPVEPARQYRQWLMQTGRFVPMSAKARSVPKVARLLGAAHVYLWGDGLLTRHDVPSNQWKPLCAKLMAESVKDAPSVGRRIKAMMAPEAWRGVEQLAGGMWPDRYVTSQVTDGLSHLLRRPDFYDAASWSGIALPPDAVRLLAHPRSSLSVPELCRLNSVLLKAAYPSAFLEVADWGDGVSLKMLRRLKEAGFDRLRLCVDGWDGVAMRPHVAAEADRLGWLFGTYDSFHSIHDPALRGTEATWETAQFDRKLYETGPIVGRDGVKLHGFKQAGYKLSPLAARPYVEKRVAANMRRAPFNYYFVDADAYGEVYDDHSPLHPATQAQDAAARAARLKWIGDAFHAVVGSEGGSAYAAPAIHVAEGVFGPGMGWGDPDLKDKKSPYYLGAYYPPDGPAVFLKPVPVKEEYAYFFLDPRFRLPLYETVFHDSVVTAHHWSSASLKYANEANTVALTELLYQVPPMYHLNLDEFDRIRKKMQRHYAFFSPLHRKLGFLPMTGFAWLTPNRLVQRTTFGTEAEVTSNFSTLPFPGVPPRSVTVRWLKTGQRETYTPALE